MAIQRYTNPYKAGAGLYPPYFAGREDVLDRARLAIGLCQHSGATQSLCYYGLRGVGKTVLLSRIEDEARQMGAQTLLIEARTSASMAGLIVPALNQLLVTLSQDESRKELIARGFSALRSFVNSIKFKYNDVEVSLDVPPEKGIADSGNYQQDFSDLLCRVGEVAQVAHTAIVILVDEIQYLSSEDLAALIQALHRTGQKNYPIVLISAGLPVILARSTEAKTYSERLFEFIELGPLSNADAQKALREPALGQGVVFTDEAAEFIMERTEGYPYFIQIWGRSAWNCAPEKATEITITDATKGDAIALATLDAGFFRSRMDRLTPKEKEFLFAMSHLHGDSVKISEIAKEMNRKLSSVSPLRAGLIKKGVIFSSQYGEVSYTVPLFADYLKRINQYR